MPYGPLKTRVIHEVGTAAYLRVYWGKDCPSCLGGKNMGYHNAQLSLTRSDKLGDWALGGKVENYPDERWPRVCDHCQATVPNLPISPPASDWVDDPAAPDGYRRVEVVNRQVFHHRVYDTPTGRPGPGDIYEIDWKHHHDGKCMEWDNCDGRHLIAVCPNGAEWEMTSRCSNCGKPQDRLHRCWIVREVTPGVFHVDKTGNTCPAGGGSILAGDYHGFLQHGVFSAG